MKKIILILFLCMLCLQAEAKCVNREKMIRLGSDLIAETFSCDFKQAILEDLAQTVEVSGICNMKWPMSKVKEKTACKAIGGYAGIMTVNIIPPKWGCHYIPHESNAHGIIEEIRGECLKRIGKVDKNQDSWYPMVWPESSMFSKQWKGVTKN